jgi:hypothetical protein
MHGSDPRNMDKPFNVSALGLARKPFGRFHMTVSFVSCISI